jgi:hypothetical protein
VRLPTLLLILAAIVLAAFFLGRRRALSLAHPAGGVRSLHSLPKYYGYYAALGAVVPGIALLLMWAAFSDSLITSRVVASLPEALRNQPEAQLSLTLNDIRNLAAGQMYDESRSAEFAVAADLYNSLRDSSRKVLAGLVVALSFSGFALAWLQLRPQFRARNRVEAVVRFMLVLASLLAIVTTIGILLLGAVGIHPLLPVRCRCMNSCSACSWSPQTAMRADQVGSSGSLRRHSAVRGNDADLRHRHAGGGAHRAVDRRSTWRNTQAHDSVRWIKAAAGSAGRHTDGGLRLFRRTVTMGPRCVASARRSVWRSPRKARWPPAW